MRRTGQFELDLFNGAAARRQDEVQAPRQRADGPTLHEQRNEHDDEGAVEEHLAVGKLAEQWHDGEQDRHRAAQPDPGDEGGLGALEVERQQAQPNRNRAGDEDQEQRQTDCGERDVGKLRRGGEQPQKQEHDDLREPAHTVLEALQCRRRAHVAVARVEAGDIDREEAASADDAGHREDEQRQRDDEDRRQPALHVQPVDQPDDQQPAEIARDQAEPHLQHEAQQHLPAQLVERGARRDDLDKRDGEEDRHRIVGPGFDFQRRADLVSDVDAADAQQEEHRRGVRRADDRAEQDRFHPAEPEQKPRRQPEDQGRDDDTHGGERKCGKRRVAERLDRRAEAGIEEDDGQRQTADEIGDAGIVEIEPDPVDAGDEADAEEQEQQRRAEAEGQQAGEGGDEHEDRADQRNRIDPVDHPASNPFRRRACLPELRCASRSPRGRGIAPRRRPVH